MLKYRSYAARSNRWPTIALLIAALAARLLVPAGFMPAATAHGVRFVPCSGHGPMAMPGGHGDPAHHGKDQPPCGFLAFACGGAAGGEGAVLAPVVASAAARLTVALRSTPTRLPARLRPPLRAPPAGSFA